MNAPTPTPLFGADLVPSWLAPPEREPDPLDALDMVHAKRMEKRAARQLETRRRHDAPTCGCERGPLVTIDEDGDRVCGRCGRWVP